MEWKIGDSKCSGASYEDLSNKEDIDAVLRETSCELIAQSSEAHAYNSESSLLPNAQTARVHESFCIKEAAQIRVMESFCINEAAQKGALDSSCANRRQSRKGVVVHSWHSNQDAPGETRESLSDVSSICSECKDGPKAEHVESFTVRSTLTLPATFALRATTPDILVGGLGWRLRANTGGIGIESGDDEYSKSFPVQYIDVFLSHSWHAWWLLKYVTLLLYFNSFAAACSAIIFGLMLRCLKPLINDMRSSATNHGQWEKHSMSDVRAICLPGGGLVFLLVLFSWHRIVKKLWVEKCARRGRSVFLDKVCIHQTDPVQKEAGIKAIGGILNNSNLLLIAWDSTYFERLWCIFELAAFKYRQSQGTVVFLPIMLGATIAIYSMMGAMNEFVRLTYIRQCRGTTWEVTEFWHVKLLWDIIFFLQNLFLIPVARKYGRDVANLRSQLENFSVHQAKCYCCCNDHQAPNGDVLSCDRELVYASIAHWHGQDNLNEQTGLIRFDRLVQKELRRDVMRTLGGWSLVPYQLALSFSIWNTLYWMDAIIALNVGWPHQVLMIFRRFFFACPFYLAFGVGLALRFPLLPAKADDNRCVRLLREGLSNTILASVMALVSEVYTLMGDQISLGQQVAPTVVLVLVEITIILLLYHPRGGSLLSRCSEYMWPPSRKQGHGGDLSETEMVKLRSHCMMPL